MVSTIGHQGMMRVCLWLEQSIYEKTAELLIGLNLQKVSVQTNE